MLKKEIEHLQVTGCPEKEEEEKRKEKKNPNNFLAANFYFHGCVEQDESF